ncbi:hypothetical protein [Actinomarinicola tropica]|uniref:hypothetical protein n=1 Tax=Actinomarinicola tropica TaxID=2789776 RepID=UPI00189A35DC|nr:hypothetical protein [Actinomarinicola tropica]
MFNTDVCDVDFALPDIGDGAVVWDVLLDTARPDEPPDSRGHHQHATITVSARTVVILQAATEPTRDRGQPGPRQGDKR